MKESTKALIFRPLLFQEAIIIGILAPVVIFFFRIVSSSVMDNFMHVSIVASIAANFGLTVGILAKYILTRPAIKVLEDRSHTRQDVERAVKSLSILPITESVLTFLRFGLTGNLIASLPLYHMGIITYAEFLGAVGTVIVIGFMAAPNVYLCSETSLIHFYRRCSLEGIMDADTRLFRLNLSKKAYATIFLLSAPPLSLNLILLYLAPTMKISMSSLQTGFWVLLVESITLTFICGYLLMKNISLSAEKMSSMMKDMAQGQGDLTKRISVTGLHEMGELAFWFNRFMENIEDIIGHVRDTSLELHRTVENVNTGSQELTQATQEQAATVEEISSSIDMMNSTIRSNAELISEGRETSNTITKLISQNKQVFSELMTAIAGISQDSRKIGDIVATVNEVAFHTNLLALNASVEAARAGEHGKGFAVVAGEVRSLAQRSAGAASEIKTLIEGTVDRIRNGDEMMKKSSLSLEELMSRMEIFFRMMEIIDSSSTEQTQSVGEVSRAISQIDTSTQQNASTAEELAGTIENLRTMAGLLAEDVQQFKTSDRNEDR